MMRDALHSVGPGMGAGRHAADAHAFLAFLDLNFRDAGFFEELNQLFYFSNVHEKISWRSCLQLADGGPHGEVVPQRAEADNAAARDVREIGMFAEALARV